MYIVTICIYCCSYSISMHNKSVGDENDAAEARANVVIVPDPVIEAPNKGISHLDEQTKLQILNLHTQGLSGRAIGLQINRSKSTVKDFLKFWREESKLKKDEKRGRKIFLAERDVRQIVIAVKRDRFITIKKIQLQMPQIRASCMTFSRTIHSDGKFNSYRAARKPFVS